jgi:ribonuclease Y
VKALTAEIIRPEAKADKLLIEAKNKQQELMLEGKEKAAQIIDEAKREEKQLRQELRTIQERLERRENTFDQKLLEFQGQEKQLQEKIERVKQIKQEIENLKEEQVTKLQQVAALTKDEAKNELLTKIEEQCKTDLMGRIIKLEKESSEVFEDKARRQSQTPRKPGCMPAAIFLRGKTPAGKRARSKPR